MDLKDKLEEAFKALDKHALPFQGGGTAELLDEADPDGVVVIKDKDGNLQMMLPREDYEEIVKLAGKR